MQGGQKSNIFIYSMICVVLLIVILSIVGYIIYQKNQESTQTTPSLTPPTPQTTPPAPIKTLSPTAYNIVKDITNYSGNDILPSPISSAVCNDQCAQNPNCVGIVINTNAGLSGPGTKDANCWMKSNFTNKSYEHGFITQRIITPKNKSNIKNLSTEAQYFITIGNDYPGNDIAPSPVDMDNCDSMCRNNPDCIATVTNIYAGKCWMKSDLSPPRKNLFGYYAKIDTTKY
jgi:hypothetical protein